MRVRIDSLGCRLNIGEAEEMARRLARRGHRVVGPGDPADLHILNTCAVTHVAVRKSRKLIRQLRRADPGAAVVVTGCYAELAAGQVRDLGADLVVGNGRKDELPEVLQEAGLLRDAEAIPAVDLPSYMPALPPGCRTRAFVKVQDGCDNRCTFCVVTVLRGPARSRPAEAVVREVRRLVELGYMEAVLTGVHLGSYGHDLGEPRGLERLVRRILRDTELPRLRLSSLEPWDLHERFFELWEDPRLLPHLHLPLQSGCDATLRRMARRTSAAAFARLVERARQAIPDVAVTTDIIVGFPGETEAEFADSLAFIEQMGFARLHVFRFSPREGTAAARMGGRVPAPVAHERSRRVHELGARLEERFRRRYLGRRLEVLWESAEPRDGARRWSGLTGNYLRVLTLTGPGADLRNRVLEAELTGTVPGALVGRTAVSIDGLGAPAAAGLRR